MKSRVLQAEKRGNKSREIGKCSLCSLTCEQLHVCIYHTVSHVGFVFVLSSYALSLVTEEQGDAFRACDALNPMEKSTWDMCKDSGVQRLVPPFGVCF